MAELETSSAALTVKDLEYANLTARWSRLMKEHIENRDPDKPFRTREMLIAADLNTADGSAAYAKWRNASDTPIQKLADMPVIGPIAPIIDLMIKDGGKEIRKRDAKLSEAEAITKFLGTDDGQALFGIGASLPAGATFEGNPRAVKRALSLVREAVIQKTAGFVTTPLTMKFSALLAAVARKNP